MIPTGFLNFCGFSGCKTGGFGEIKNPSKLLGLLYLFVLKGERGIKGTEKQLLNTFPYSNSECLFLDNKAGQIL